MLLTIALLAACGATAPAAGPASADLPAPALRDTVPAREHRIGPDDLLQITVFEASEMNATVRVSATGQVAIPLLGPVPAAGLTPAQLAAALQDRLRKTYILDPHVSVQVNEIGSRPVSVLGAVKQPGVLQLRGPRRLSEVLAMAGGLTEDAGDRAVIVRGGAGAVAGAAAPDAAGAEQGEVVDLRGLLESADPRHDVAVAPGDVVKVLRASMVYVVGEVNQPGAFPLHSREGLTVLQAVALGRGLKPGAARNRIHVIRRGPAGERATLRVGWNDPTPLQPDDVVFVPGNAARSFSLGVVDALVRMVTFRGVF